MAPLLAAASKGLLVLGIACASAACGPAPSPHTAPSKPERAPTPAAPSSGARPTGDEARYARTRARMVDEQLAARDITDPAVLEAMRRVPRHEFVDEALREHAYDDSPLPIAAGQTISQPYIVALMTQLAAVSPGDRVLEVGTGSGYQAAVLAALGAEVYSIEIVPELAQSASATLARLGYRVQVRHGDGYAGWPEHAPFDAILVTAAPPRIPPPLEEQLAPGGKLIAPVGDRDQELIVVTRTDGGLTQTRVIPVRFVPMTGRAREPSTADPNR